MIEGFGCALDGTTCSEKFQISQNRKKSFDRAFGFFMALTTVGLVDHSRSIINMYLPIAMNYDFGKNIRFYNLLCLFMQCFISH